MFKLKNLPIYSLLLIVTLLGGCSFFNAPDKVKQTIKVSNIKVAVKWRFNEGSSLINNVLFKPGVINDKVVIASSKGNIYILDLNSGQLLKTFTLKQKILSGVGVDNQDIFVVTNDYKLVALNLQDGSINWQVKLDDTLLQTPEIVGDKIIVYTANNVIEAYNTTNGQSVWVYPAGVNTGIEISLHELNVITAVGSNAVAIGLPDGSLNLLDINSGKAIWITKGQLTITGVLPIDQLVNILGPVAIDGDMLCFSNYLHSLSCVARATGEVIWSKKQEVYSNVLLHDGRAYILQEAGQVIAFDQATGVIAWQSGELQGHDLNSFSFLKGYLIVQEQGNYLSVFDPNSGELLAHQKLEVDGSSKLYNFGPDILLLNNSHGSIIRLSVNN